jgi:elongation of very long chain fatty acids protein 6
LSEEHERELFRTLERIPREQRPGPIDLDFLENDNSFKMLAAVLYLPVVFGLKYWVGTLPESEQTSLRRLLGPLNAAWDLFLCVFSGLGSYYTVSHLLTNNYDCSFIENATTIHWLDLFCRSKTFELLDTVFIVLRGRPLVLLQYYHHLATLVMAERGMAFYPRELLLFAAINYSVHVLMYGYFFLHAIGFKSIRKYGYLITLVQILQMFVAVYELLTHPLVSCNHPEYNSYYEYYCSVFMYASYAFLFVKLLIERKVKSE